MFNTITIRANYSRHVLRAHLQGFAPLGFAAFIRAAAHAVAL